MDVEYTGRHYEVTPANRKEIEEGLAKLRKILRNKFEAKVILAVEKRRHKAEITVNSRFGSLVGLAQAGDMTAAIGEAIEATVSGTAKPSLSLPAVLHLRRPTRPRPQ